MAIAERVLFAMYRSGLNGSSFGSVNTNGSCACAEDANARRVSAVHANGFMTVCAADRREAKYEDILGGERVVIRSTREAQTSLRMNLV